MRHMGVSLRRTHKLATLCSQYSCLIPLNLLPLLMRLCLLYCLLAVSFTVSLQCLSHERSIKKMLPPFLRNYYQSNPCKHGLHALTTTLQSLMNVKLCHQEFWPCQDNWLKKKIAVSAKRHELHGGFIEKDP